MTLIIWRGESNTVIDDQVIERLQATDTFIENVDLMNCNLTGCNFLKAKFINVTFTRCKFKRCDFSTASFSQCGFWDTQFDDCKLIGINWAVVGLAFNPQFQTVA